LLQYSAQDEISYISRRIWIIQACAASTGYLLAK
jgi:hypothetical protein